MTSLVWEGGGVKQAYFIRIGELSIVGASPEMLVRAEGRVVETHPIAGTRPRGGTDEEDERLADELIADQKERAEHVMLVDLARNDVGRVVEFGTEVVEEMMTLERYSHVMHSGSNHFARATPFSPEVHHDRCLRF